MSDSPYVAHATEETFTSLVLEAEVPVLVDFWADWCAPCRMLMPVLTQVVEAYQGQVRLVKVNTDQEQTLAARFGVRSLPTVKLFRGGVAVDEFMGALPEGDVRRFLEKHLPRESDKLADQARDLLAAGDGAAAADLLARALAEDPSNPRVIQAAAEVQLLLRRPEQAEQLLDTLPLGEHDSEVVRVLRGKIGFEKILRDAPAPEVLQQRLQAEPADLEAQYQLAAYKVIQGNYEAALEDFFRILQKNRQFADDGARRAILNLFELLGSGSELVSRYRSRLFTALH